MVRLFYFWQEPGMVPESDTFTEKTLVMKVGLKYFDRKKLPGIKDVQNFFFNEYKCNNMKKRCMSLRI